MQERSALAYTIRLFALRSRPGFITSKIKFAMSMIFYDEVKRMYILPIKAEYQKVFMIEQDALAHSDREALNGLERKMAKLYTEHVRLIKKRKKYTQLRISACLFLLLLALVYILLNLRSNIENRTVRIVTNSIMIICSVTSLAYLLFRYNTGWESDRSLSEHLEITDLDLQIKKEFFN